MPTPRIIRSPRSAAVSYAQAHVEPFTDHAALLGLSPQQLESYTTAVENAKEALAQAVVAKQAWKAAAGLAAGRMRELNRAMTETVDTIDVTASKAADPVAVYQAALLPMPNTPGVMAAPGVCNGFRAALNPEGSVTISWKCKNPDNAHGTIYQVLRKLPQEAEFRQLELTANKRFTDESIPTGAGRAQYVVQARRGNAVGPASGKFTVQLGSGGGSAATGIAKANLAA
jgi:hypothetical protein